ncbi:MAG: hypothetical protein F4Y01_03630, partial [Gammaproteobacteria bacterium]|nr:hypothetical protein [Gammaproteobacteria bacterium]
MAESVPTPEVSEPIEADGAKRGAVRLPFAFARRFGVVITTDPPAADGAVTLACRARPELTTLAEVRRVVRRPLRLSIVGASGLEV